MTVLEIAANVMAAASILLAARNSVHTWWTGIVGCGLFAFVFLHSRLYADTVLQVFFVITSIVGWWQWLHGSHGEELQVTDLPARKLWLQLLCGVVGLPALASLWLLYPRRERLPLPGSQAPQAAA